MNHSFLWRLLSNRLNLFDRTDYLFWLYWFLNFLIGFLFMLFFYYRLLLTRWLIRWLSPIPLSLLFPFFHVFWVFRFLLIIMLFLLSFFLLFFVFRVDFFGTIFPFLFFLALLLFSLFFLFFLFRWLSALNNPNLKLIVLSFALIYSDGFESFFFLMWFGWQDNLFFFCFVNLLLLFFVDLELLQSHWIDQLFDFWFFVGTLKNRLLICRLIVIQLAIQVQVPLQIIRIFEEEGLLVFVDLRDRRSH